MNKKDIVRIVKWAHPEEPYSVKDIDIYNSVDSCLDQVLPALTQKGYSMELECYRKPNESFRVECSIYEDDRQDPISIFKDLMAQDEATNLYSPILATARAICKTVLQLINKEAGLPY